MEWVCCPQGSDAGMTLANFKNAPWSTSHEKYSKSALSISPAPEYANSEVLVASLYRTIGYETLSEGSVPQTGRDLDKKIQKLRDKHLPSPQGSTVGVDTWNTVLHGILESPKLPNQSSKRFLQITPLVPGAAIFSGSARLAGNPWKPGGLIRRMVWLGSKDLADAKILWEELFAALSVGENDDIFARWLQEEMSAWHPSAHWQQSGTSDAEFAILSSDDLYNIHFLPARQFTRDLRTIIQAKDAMTRRQWTSLLEAVLRLASVSHVTWLCDVQTRIWRCLLDALENKGPTTESEARQAVFPAAAQYMVYGGKALHALKDRTSAYLTARLGINTVLWSLVHAGVPYEGDISSSRGITDLCQHIRDNHHGLLATHARETFLDIREREARALNCRKGIGSNLLEFARHTLGQRQTAVQLLRGYDQGYVLRKRGSAPSSPWVVSLGPVAVLAVVHCALAGMGGPRSIHRLSQHLASYGIAVDRHVIASNDLGNQLRMLGLVLDSPDAESGMLLLPPFPATQAKGNER